MLYTDLFAILATLGFLVGFFGCIITLVFGKGNAKQRCYAAAAVGIAGGIVLLTGMILFSRVKTTALTFYGDEYNIVDMADEYGVQKYKKAEDRERERMEIQYCGNGRRIILYLHENTKKALEERNSHKDYEQFKK